jgi:glycosyltransferase involved in cell wall biosynthesis
MVYTSFHGLPYFLPLAASLLDRNKVVYGVHNVHTPEGATHETWMRVYHQFAFKAFKRFHVFSTHQLEVISRLLPGKDHYYAPLLPDNYGPSSVSAPPDRVRFLFFGYIRRYKRLDLLIRAFQSLCEAGYRNIELVIAGRCDDWKCYEELIGDTPNVTVRIGVVPNRDVADLVSSCHYVVMPYQDSAQSAVVTLAYNYRRPVIVSDIDAFAGVVRPGQTGLVFPSLSSDGLANAMEQAVQGHPHTFNEFTAKVESFMRREYAIEGIVAQYEAFMDETIASAATA